MEALKFIPQLFFDLLGRIVPGFLAMILGLLVYYQIGHNISWKELSEASFWLASIVAFIIGHLVSPLTKAIQRWHEVNADPLKGIKKFAFKLFILFFKKEIKAKESKVIGDYIESQKSHNEVHESSSNEFGNITNSQSDKIVNKKNMSDKDTRSHMYNWLRIKEADAGALCAKLRAEFTMYNSFAAIFLVYCVVEFVILIRSFIFYQEISLINGLVLIGCTILFFAMSNRGLEGEDTFEKDVIKFYELAHAPAIDNY